jgi:hypothetical protein
MRDWIESITGMSQAMIGRGDQKRLAKGAQRRLEERPD